MYLRQLYIENSGPLSLLTLEMPFLSNDAPKPVVMVGGNGTGKTNLLSIVADALFEAAAVHYVDMVPGQSPLNRPWFRIVGTTTISVGASGGCAILEFEHAGTTHFYKEKAGQLPARDVMERVPELLRPGVAWETEGNVKAFSINDVQAKAVFDEGAYVYFPSSRAEVPHWLNRDSVKADEFDVATRIAKRLGKPIYVEHGLDQLKQWLLALLIDIRMDFAAIPAAEPGNITFTLLGNPDIALAHRATWDYMNRILQAIFDDNSVALGWAGRKAQGRLVVHRNGVLVVPSLDALSAGQTTILNIFGTLLRYGDSALTQLTLAPEQTKGICIIDEIDAHMHVELQYRALPVLIKMFPMVQFIVSSHSPLFVLGMENTFGPEGLVVIDMPSGMPIQAEAYAEFGRALKVIQDTKAFNRAIIEAAGAPGNLLVLLEGETDPKYLRTAAQLLDRAALLDSVEFDWVGAKDPHGQGFHTGKSGLNATLNLLLSKPKIVRRTVLLLYDNDANKASQNYGHVHVQSTPTNVANKLIEAGIENLLPEAAITIDMFDEKVSKKPNGNSTVTRTLDKMKLCNYICEVKRDPGDFVGFSDVLNIVESLAKHALAAPI